MIGIMGDLSAQNSKLVNISYDPQGDSIFFAKMHKYMAEIRKTRPTVAVVLAGGGAKGAAHIGVLKYLEEKGLPVDFVAGTSMGGLMGGLYAMGYSALEIDSIVRSIDWNVMMSDDIPMGFYAYNNQRYKETYAIDIPFSRFAFKKSLPSGYLYGLNVYNMMSSLSVGYQQKMDFMDLPTPYACVATEIVTQTEKHWTSGSLIPAMRSTMSIPGFFRPVRIDSMILSDGGTKNNFPTDLAVAAGADIIIGVEMTMPRHYDDVNNVADILMQTAQYSGGLEAHNRNVKNTTVYITPDISGFGMLSFGTKEIATLIERGYNEAAKHEREIDSVVRIVGNGGRHTYHPKAINLAVDKVTISSVEYVGLNEKEKRYLDGKIRMKFDEPYGKEDFEVAQSIIFGTRAFSQVTYELIDDGKGSYKLVFNCEKRPKHSLGIGLRADTEEWFAALINLGLNRNKIYGHEFDIIARLSTSPYLKLDYSYTPIRGPKVGASLKVHYRMLFGVTDLLAGGKMYIEQSLRNEATVYISDTHWSMVNLWGGFRVEQMPIYRYFGSDGSEQNNDWKTFYPYLFVRCTFSNQDDRYFPNKGVRCYLNYDYNFKNTHFLATGVIGTIPAPRIFTLIASLRARYIVGGGNKYEYMENYVGGTMEGRYYDHQIPFIGMNGEFACYSLLTLVDFNFRFKVYKNCYLSAIASAFHDGMIIDNKLVMRGKLLYEKPEDEATLKPTAVYAAGIQFAYKTKFGPIMANVHWNSHTNKVGLYIGAGFDF
jgi:NTE family protein